MNPSWATEWSDLNTIVIVLSEEVIMGGKVLPQNLKQTNSQHTEEPLASFKNNARFQGLFLRYCALRNS